MSEPDTLAQVVEAKTAYERAAKDAREASRRLDRAVTAAAASVSYREIARVVGWSHSEVERRVHAHRARHQH